MLFDKAYPDIRFLKSNLTLFAATLYVGYQLF